MLIADVTFTTEGVVVITALLVAVSGALVYIYRKSESDRDREYARLLADKEREYNRMIAENEKDKRELENTKKAYGGIAQEAVKAYKDTVNNQRTKDGQPPVQIVAPVITESNSPSTAKQREDAEISTLRAQMAAVKLADGQEPRKEPPHAIEPGVAPKDGKTSEIVDVIGTLAIKPVDNK